MHESRVAGPLGALRAIHDQLWDERAGMCRLAPGAHPGVDLRGVDPHPVRETALGAILDLRDGRGERAVTAIRSVLACQRELSTEPWSGTFALTAEEPPPPPDPVEWVDYDPNWRQFIGCTLACALELHSGVIDEQTRSAMEAAIERAVHGEPAGRIPVWYTNPALMHAWLTAWVGARSGDDALVRRGEAIGARVAARFERYGDVDEYNSPTYDGVDLFALALWQRFAPSPWFEERGAAIAARLAGRMSVVYHPRLAAICGPYIRAYAISLDRSVGLAGQWLALAGADERRVLPPNLDAATDHVHDLWFLPLFDELAPTVVPHLSLIDVAEERRHVQRFGPVTATSVLDARSAIGAERGRVHEFARDQYVPFTVHVDDGGETRALGMLIPDATATADCDIVASGQATIELAARTDTTAATLLMSEEPSIDGRVLELGPIRIGLTDRPAAIDVRSVSTGVAVDLSWKAGRTGATVHVR